MNVTEWQTSNSKIRYPFAEMDAEASMEETQIPQEFLLDLSISISPFEVDYVYLYSVIYDSESDEITLEFRANDETVVLQGVFDRGGDPGVSRSFQDGAQSIVFTPGDAWINPLDYGLQDGVEIVFSHAVGRLEASTFHTGPRAVMEILLDGPHYNSEGEKVLTPEAAISDPSLLFPMRDIRLIAGYNISFGGSDSSTISVDVVPGAGEGYSPCQETECLPEINNINGAIPDSNGNVWITPIDCLRQSESQEVDPETLDPLNNGIRLFSDCTPCCTCDDYNKVSRAISRQSAKLRDANGELLKMIECFQLRYDSATEVLNQNSSGLVAIENVKIYPSRLSFSVRNLTNIPLYAILAIDIPEGTDIAVIPGQGNVRTGIQVTDPPLTGLGGGPATGLEDPTSVDGWRELGYYITVGGDDSFNPIQGGKSTIVTLWSPESESKLASLEAACNALRAYYSTSSVALDIDEEYQGYLSELSSLLLSGDCLQESSGNEDEITVQEYKCRVEEQALSTRRSELSDKIYARRLQIAFGIDICETPIVLPAVESLLEDLKNLDTLVPSECKDGSYTCSGSPISCTSAAFDDLGCAAAERNQAEMRAKIYEDLAEVLTDQEKELDTALSTCLGNGMFVDKMPTLDVSASAIYGDFNFGCKAFNGEFSTQRQESENDSGFACLEDLISIYTLATQI